MMSERARRGGGYSVRLAVEIQAGDETHPGVALGQLCVAKDIPVAQVAADLGVSRQAVYLWFTGRAMPLSHALSAITALAAVYEKR